MTLQLVLSGLSNGALYAVVAVGIVLVYRASGVINFAHGELATFCTFTAWAAWNAGAPIGVAVLVGLVVAGVAGVGIETLVISRLRNRSHINEVMATVALFLMINGLTLEVFGHTQRRFPTLVNGPRVSILGATLSRQALLIIIFTLVMTGLLTALLRWTSIGVAMRAIAESPESARLIGLPVTFIVRGAWLVAAVLGTAAGVLVAPLVFLNVDMMIGLLIKGFAGAVVGGLTSLYGAIVGALLLGVGESLVSGYISSELATTFTFVVLILALVVRPQGLFGRRTEVKL